MKLYECLKKHNLVLDPSAPGTLVIDGMGVRDLYHLTDYTVSSQSCGSLWMLPKTTDIPATKSKAKS